jgi:hypothetical protein
MSACRSCQAPVIWTATRGQRTMPVDAEPHPDGNVRLTYDPLHEGIVVADVLGPLEALATDEDLHRPHFATCPHADDWRRTR